MASSALFNQCQSQLYHSIRSHRHVACRGLATVVDVPKPHRLAVGILLNRSPNLTRTPTKFEQEFYKYQQRIQRALHNPFANDFYFKQGSVLEAQFNQDEIRRERKAFGPSFVKGKEDKSSLLMNIETSGEEDEKPMPRRTEADEKKDVKSLDRHGTRNMYLLVKSADEGKPRWRFPKGYVETGEFMHEAAKRDLHAECGPNMNTWVVGRRPVGLYEDESLDPQYASEKVFFYKAHIFAGQAKPVEKRVTDFAWLTKEEIESYVDKEYWDGTKDMLSDF